jgi:hypothetical protein
MVIIMHEQPHYFENVRGAWLKLAELGVGRVQEWYVGFRSE